MRGILLGLGLTGSDLKASILCSHLDVSYAAVIESACSQRANNQISAKKSHRVERKSIGKCSIWKLFFID